MGFFEMFRAKDSVVPEGGGSSVLQDKVYSPPPEKVAENREKAAELTKRGHEVLRSMVRPIGTDEIMVDPNIEGAFASYGIVDADLRGKISDGKESIKGPQRVTVALVSLQPFEATDGSLKVRPNMDRETLLDFVREIYGPKVRPATAHELAVWGNSRPKFQSMASVYSLGAHSGAETPVLARAQNISSRSKDAPPSERRIGLDPPRTYSGYRELFLFVIDEASAQTH